MLPGMSLAKLPRPGTMTARDYLHLSYSVLIIYAGFGTSGSLPDLSVFIIGMFMCSWLLAYLCAGAQEKSGYSDIALLCALAVTFKLSFIFPAAVTMAIITPMAVMRKQRSAIIKTNTLLFRSAVGISVFSFYRMRRRCPLESPRTIRRG
jgi:hypothetical protein